MEGVIANSFPKSGTHILTRILELLGYKTTDTHLSRSLVMYGRRNIIRNIKILNRVDSNGLRVDIENTSKRIKETWLEKHIYQKLSDKAYCQAHLPFTTELDNVLSRIEVKSLYIHRNPKDVLVSLKNYILKLKHHPNHKMMSQCGSDDERFALLLDGYNKGNNINYIAPFLEKYTNSQQWLTSQNNCSISYEKIIGQQGGGKEEDQVKELNRVLAYLGVSLDVSQSIRGNIFNRESATFHKGKIGQWKNEFSHQTNDLFKSKFNALAQAE